RTGPRRETLPRTACPGPGRGETFGRPAGRPAFARFARKPARFVRGANAEGAAPRRAVEEIIRTKDRDEWYDLLVKADVCVGKVYDVEEMAHDPQVNHRQMIVDIQHPTHGTVRQFGIAIKMSETPGHIRRAPPVSGEHTDDVLK